MTQASMNEEDTVNETENLTFEQAFAELEETARKLEAGGLTLEESLALFERGQELAARCNVQLDEAELKVRQLSPEGVVPFEPEG
jgi:exodeoxyribonuclease VII small subunit